MKIKGSTMVTLRSLTAAIVCAVFVYKAGLTTCAPTDLSSLTGNKDASAEVGAYPRATKAPSMMPPNNDAKSWQPQKPSRSKLITKSNLYKKTSKDKGDWAKLQAGVRDKHFYSPTLATTGYDVEKDNLSSHKEAPPSTTAPENDTTDTVVDNVSGLKDYTNKPGTNSSALQYSMPANPPNHTTESIPTNVDVDIDVGKDIDFTSVANTTKADKTYATASTTEGYHAKAGILVASTTTTTMQTGLVENPNFNAKMSSTSSMETTLTNDDVQNIKSITTPTMIPILPAHSKSLPVNASVSSSLSLSFSQHPVVTTNIPAVVPKLDVGHDGVKITKKKQLFDKHFIATTGPSQAPSSSSSGSGSLHPPITKDNPWPPTLSRNKPSKSGKKLMEVPNGYLGPIIMKEKTISVFHHDKKPKLSIVEQQLRDKKLVEIIAPTALMEPTIKVKSFTPSPSPQPEFISIDSGLSVTSTMTTTTGGTSTPPPVPTEATTKGAEIESETATTYFLVVTQDAKSVSKETSSETTKPPMDPEIVPMSSGEMEKTLKEIYTEVINAMEGRKQKLASTEAPQKKEIDGSSSEASDVANSDQTRKFVEPLVPNETKHPVIDHERSSNIGHLPNSVTDDPSSRDKSVDASTSDLIGPDQLRSSENNHEGSLNIYHLPDLVTDPAQSSDESVDPSISDLIGPNQPQSLDIYHQRSNQHSATGREKSSDSKLVTAEHLLLTENNQLRSSSIDHQRSSSIDPTRLSVEKQSARDQVGPVVLNQLRSSGIDSQRPSQNDHPNISDTDHDGSSSAAPPTSNNVPNPSLSLDIDHQTFSYSDHLQHSGTDRVRPSVDEQSTSDIIGPVVSNQLRSPHIDHHRSSNADHVQHSVISRKESSSDEPSPSDEVSKQARSFDIDHRQAPNADHLQHLVTERAKLSHDKLQPSITDGKGFNSEPDHRRTPSTSDHVPHPALDQQESLKTFPSSASKTDQHLFPVDKTKQSTVTDSEGITSHQQTSKNIHPTTSITDHNLMVSNTQAPPLHAEATASNLFPITFYGSSTQLPSYRTTGGKIFTIPFNGITGHSSTSMPVTQQDPSDEISSPSVANQNTVPVRSDSSTFTDHSSTSPVVLHQETRTSPTPFLNPGHAKSATSDGALKDHIYTYHHGLTKPPFKAKKEHITPSITKDHKLPLPTDAESTINKDHKVQLVKNEGSTITDHGSKLPTITDREVKAKVSPTSIKMPLVTKKDSKINDHDSSVAHRNDSAKDHDIILITDDTQIVTTEPLNIDDHVSTFLRPDDLEEINLKDHRMSLVTDNTRTIISESSTIIDRSSNLDGAQTSSTSNTKKKLMADHDSSFLPIARGKNLGQISPRGYGMLSATDSTRTIITDSSKINDPDSTSIHPQDSLEVKSNHHSMSPITDDFRTINSDGSENNDHGSTSRNRDEAEENRPNQHSMQSTTGGTIGTRGLTITDRSLTTTHRDGSTSPTITTEDPKITNSGLTFSKMTHLDKSPDVTPTSITDGISTAHNFAPITSDISTMTSIPIIHHDSSAGTSSTTLSPLDMDKHLPITTPIPDAVPTFATITTDISSSTLKPTHDSEQTESKISDIQIEVYDSTVEPILASTNFKDNVFYPSSHATTNEAPSNNLPQERFTQYVVDKATDFATQDSNSVAKTSGKPEPAAIEIHINVSEGFGNESEDLEFSYRQADFRKMTSKKPGNTNFITLKPFDAVPQNETSNEAAEEIVVEIIDSSSNSTENSASRENLNVNPIFTFRSDDDSQVELKNVKYYPEDSPKERAKSTDDFFVPHLGQQPSDSNKPMMDRDSDTIFYISNTEVKVGESLPTTNTYDAQMKKSRLESQFFPANYEERKKVVPQRYEEDIILSPLKNRLSDPLKLVRGPLDISYVGESVMEVEQVTLTTTTPPPVSGSTPPDVIIQPAILPEMAIGVPVIGELPPQIELKEIDFMPNFDGNKEESSIQYGGDLIDEGGAMGAGFDMDSYPLGNMGLGQKNDAISSQMLLNHRVNHLKKDELSADLASSESADGNDLLRRSNDSVNGTIIGEKMGNATAYSVMEEPPAGDRPLHFTDLHTLFTACFATLLPLVLSVVMAFGLRHLYRKYQTNPFNVMGRNSSTDPLDAEKGTGGNGDVDGVETPDELRASSLAFGATTDSASLEIRTNSNDQANGKVSDDGDGRDCNGSVANGRAPASDMNVDSIQAIITDDDVQEENATFIVNCNIESVQPMAPPTTIPPQSTTTTNAATAAAAIATNPSAGTMQCNYSGANGSITTMTLKNNHLIVETEERNDISRDARETKMHYNNSEKDGVFVVEVSRGADSKIMPGSPVADDKHPFPLDAALKITQNGEDNPMSSHEEVQIHPPPPENISIFDEIDSNHLHQIDEVDEFEEGPKMSRHSNTGLSQSDLSSSSSVDSNKRYSYGNQELYTIEQQDYTTPSPAATKAPHPYAEPQLPQPENHNDDNGHSENGHCLENGPPTASNCDSIYPADTDSDVNGHSGVESKPKITAALLKQDTVIVNEMTNGLSHNEDDEPTPHNSMENLRNGLAPIMKTCDIAIDYGGDTENGFDSIISLPDPPSTEEMKQMNDIILMETNQLDSLPPPPPPALENHHQCNGNGNAENGDSHSIGSSPSPMNTPTKVMMTSAPPTITVATASAPTDIPHTNGNCMTGHNTTTASSAAVVEVSGSS